MSHSNCRLTREADLEQLLSETTCREIYRAHVYVQVSNFARLASDGLYAEDDYKLLIQGVHIYERAVTRIVEGLGGVLVHFQGPKLHALFYRPIDDSEQLAVRAVLLQLVLKDFVKTIVPKKRYASRRWEKYLSAHIAQSVWLW